MKLQEEVNAITKVLDDMQHTRGTQILATCLLLRAAHLFRLLKAAGYETDESLAKTVEAFKKDLAEPTEMPTIVDVSTNQKQRVQ